MRKVTKGGVTIKLWDLGGQSRFRSMWERYCRGVQARTGRRRQGDARQLRASCAAASGLLALLGGLIPPFFLYAPPAGHSVCGGQR